MPMVGCVVSESLVILGIVIAGSSGIPGLLACRTSMIGQYVSTLMAVFGAGIGLGGVGFVLAGIGAALTGAGDGPSPTTMIC